MHTDTLPTQLVAEAFSLAFRNSNSHDETAGLCTIITYLVHGLVKAGDTRDPAEIAASLGMPDDLTSSIPKALAIFFSESSEASEDADRSH